MMSPEKQQYLYDKFPKLFASANKPMTETSMCWGICCNDGWFALLEKLCEDIQAHCASVGEHITFEQVKEKFGGLRVYTSGGDRIINDLLIKAEDDSIKICEDCGSTLNIMPTKSWIRYLCLECRMKLSST